MSDEAEPVKPAEPAAASKPSKAMLGLLVLNLAGTGLVAFKMLTAQPIQVPAGQGTAHAATKPSVEVAGPVVALDPFVVNLDEVGTSRYLKLTLQLELAPKAEETLTKNKELVRDTILSHLSGLHLKDTLGAEAKEKLRQELIAKVTKITGPDKVRRIFFQDFMVQ
jgi:flagellar FliL protein